MTDFGTKGFMTLEPNAGTQEEQISFSGITQNANGTATLTGVKSVLFVAPYTETSGLAKTHAGGSPAIVSNTSGFYNELTSKDDDETVNGAWTFIQTITAPAVDGLNTPTSGETTKAANVAYVNAVAIAGAPNADLTVKGIVEIATATEINSGATTGGTGASVVVRPDQFALSNVGLAAVGDNTDIAVGAGNKFVTQTGLQHNTEKYAADAGANDTYVITLSPVPISYTNGMVVYFKANTANTGAATINVNGLGAKTIVKNLNTALADNDILAGQFCTLIYDGTNFVLQNPTANTPASGAFNMGTDNSRSMGATSGNLVIAHGLGRTPRYIRISAGFTTPATSSEGSSIGTYNGTNNYCVWISNQGASFAPASGVSSAIIILFSTSTDNQTATATFDATNITLAFVKSGAPVGTINLMWEAYA